MEKEVKKENAPAKKTDGSKVKFIIAGIIGIAIVGALIVSQICCDTATKQPAKTVTRPKQDNIVVVALIGSDKISIKELENRKNAVPQLKDMPMDANLYNKLLDILVTERVILKAAKQAKVEKDPVVKKALEDNKNQILTQAFLAQKIKEKATPEKYQAVYDKMMESYVPEEEIHARHILVETEKQAKDLIVKLKAGAKFDELANKYSKDNNPNGDNGGDLGYFKKRMMIPDFANAAFAIKKGQISEKPVKTPFGWHIIKVEDRRIAEKPTINEVAEEVQARFNEEIIPVIIAEEIQKAQVSKYDPLGLNKAAQAAQQAPAQQPAQQQPAEQK